MKPELRHKYLDMKKAYLYATHVCLFVHLLI